MQEDIRPPVRVGGPKKPARFNMAKLRNNLRALIYIAVLLIILLLGYGYLHTKHQLNDTKTQTSPNATQDLVNKVSKLVVLPAGETPTTATVNDVTKLKSQEFFSHAQNGDKVLIYSKSGRAILYRPAINKVVEYTEVNFTNTPSS